MKWILIGIAAAAALFFAVTYICYRMVFAVSARHKKHANVLLKGAQYQKVGPQAQVLMDAAVRIPYEEVSTQSGDGLRLCGRLYEQGPGAPIQIQFHGYRSHALRDFSGGLPLALSCGCTVLLVDQRAHGKSEGRCLSFGIREQQDVLHWIAWVQARYGTETPIVLSGVSMGAATVLMAAGLPLPEAVRGIVADCGYSSPRAIIRQVIRDRKYPLQPTYFFVRMAGILYGGFDIDKHSAAKALKRAWAPVLLIHGEDDRFVPCAMSRENFEACASRKTLLTVPGAGHGLSYLIDTKSYCLAVKQFLDQILHPEA